MQRNHHVRKDKGSENHPTEKELHQLFIKLAELVDKVAENRHIETLKAYYIIDRIIKFYLS